jgi:16S rRNA G527 N7-methylase RsmG
LLEPVNKKAAFLAEVARLLGLAGVRVITKQFEHYELPEHTADFITARGIRPGSDLLSWARCTLRSGGKLVLWLGRKDAEHLAAVAGWTWMPPAQIPTSDNRFLLSGIPA